MTSLLDLIATAQNPELTFAENVRLRDIVARDRAAHPASGDAPWASGVPDGVKKDVFAVAASENADLMQRIAVLELTVALLADQLVRSGALDKRALGEAMSAAHERAESMRREAESHVTCSLCKKVVHVDEAVRRTTGVLCLACHEGSSHRPRANVPEGHFEDSKTTTRYS